MIFKARCIYDKDGKKEVTENPNVKSKEEIYQNLPSFHLIYIICTVL